MGLASLLTSLVSVCATRCCARSLFEGGSKALDQSVQLQASGAHALLASAMSYTNIPRRPDLPAAVPLLQRCMQPCAGTSCQALQGCCDSSQLISPCNSPSSKRVIRHLAPELSHGLAKVSWDSPPTTCQGASRSLLSRNLIGLGVAGRCRRSGGADLRLLGLRAGPPGL